MSEWTAVIDYGMGNLHSVEKALEREGGRPRRVTTPAELTDCQRLVLPGVGAFGEAVRQLEETGLRPAIEERVAGGAWLLGICLGHQLLFESSQEKGHHQGFGFVSGRVVRLPDHLRIPHIGWNQLHPGQTAHPLLDGVAPGAYVYFVHSYAAVDVPTEAVVADTDYEDVRFVSLVARDRVAGAQFHPEKSQQVGLRIVRNFLRWSG